MYIYYTCSAILCEFGVNVRALISGGGRVGGDVLGEEEEVVVVGVEGAGAGIHLGRLGDLEEDGRGRDHRVVGAEGDGFSLGCLALCRLSNMKLVGVNLATVQLYGQILRS